MPELRPVADLSLPLTVATLKPGIDLVGKEWKTEQAFD